ncbi:MAG TPA: hypothetical protein VL588_05525 [Bdellovibrionota bacterium]|jgi:hypothetical protein|nr:hypothetical protein [Bdellovibrionota bacterium]
MKIIALTMAAAAAVLAVPGSANAQGEDFKNCERILRQSGLDASTASVFCKDDPKATVQLRDVASSPIFESCMKVERTHKFTAIEAIVDCTDIHVRIASQDARYGKCVDVLRDRGIAPPDAELACAGATDPDWLADGMLKATQDPKFPACMQVLTRSGEISRKRAMTDCADNLLDVATDTRFETCLQNHPTEISNSDGSIQELSRYASGAQGRFREYVKLRCADFVRADQKDDAEAKATYDALPESAKLMLDVNKKFLAQPAGAPADPRVQDEALTALKLFVFEQAAEIPYGASAVEDGR